MAWFVPSHTSIGDRLKSQLLRRRQEAARWPDLILHAVFLLPSFLSFHATDLDQYDLESFHLFMFGFGGGLAGSGKRIPKTPNHGSKRHRPTRHIICQQGPASGRKTHFLN
jgi:hypothetical protein